MTEATPRRLTGGRLVIASHNEGKVREFGELLAPYGIAAVSAGALGLPVPDETGDSFAANARLKAIAAAGAAGLPALADNSGLEVAALGGAPGILSARWAGPDGDFAGAMARIWREIAGQADHGAGFVCVLCLAWPDLHVETFEGYVAGDIVWPPRGAGGFGYDPIFQPRGRTQTFAEVEPAAKHADGHRAAAFRWLAAACLG